MEKAIAIPEQKKLSANDFASDQLVRWCPGCGDYAILAAMKKTLPKLDIPKEDIVFVSGIGCAARFPYYLDTYGFHTIHGRGPAVATGIKLANPKLCVWEIQGDGDAMAIGGNHLIHAVRRNVDFNILIFNNEIYGLTKGQCSPTSAQGLVTKSTPHGVAERPFHIGSIVLGAQSAFFARTVDAHPAQMSDVFLAAARHEGAAVVEILQRCPIFNDKAHAPITDKERRDDAQLHLVHGEPMLFGKDKRKGLRLNGLSLEVATLGQDNVAEEDILVHDAHAEDPTLHALLARLGPPHFPTALGVIRAVKQPAIPPRKPVTAQKSERRSIDDLLRSGATWKVE